MGKKSRKWNFFSQFFLGFPKSGERFDPLEIRISIALSMS